MLHNADNRDLPTGPSSRTICTSHVQIAAHYPCYARCGFAVYGIGAQAIYHNGT